MNVVMIMADQLRCDALGEHTPAINALRAEGIEFTQSYCSCPLCVPARGSIFTGLYPNENGSIINPWFAGDAVHGDVREGITNYYRFFEEDFDLWHTGKQHLFTAERMDADADSKVHWNSLEKLYGDHLARHGKRRPGGADFKDAVPEMAYGTTTRARNYSIPATGCYEDGFESFFDGHILEESLKAIRDRDTGKPFMLNAMFLAPHPPLEIPEPWFSKIREADFELPENVGAWSKNQSPLQLYNLTGVLGSRLTREEWREVWRVYLGLVSLLDHCVGEIVRELKAQNLYDETLILFTSDHGEMLGSHRLWQKMCMYEESVRTPMIWKLPKRLNIAAGTRDGYVSGIDIFPTICEILGKPVPEGISGRSLLPRIVDTTVPGRREIYIQFDGNGARGNFQRCLIEDGWKLIADIFKDEIFLELYRISEDPQERENQAFEPGNAERMQRMIAKLSRHMRSTGDQLTIPDDLYAEFIAKYAEFAEV